MPASLERPRTDFIFSARGASSTLYSGRERAALGWTEALTLVSQTHAPDDAYEAVRQHFTEDEQVNLTLLIAQSNAWNRINIGFRRSTRPSESQARPDGSRIEPAIEDAPRAAAIFDPLRPSLVRVAYRMLGSVADAEDVVQEAFLRWLDVDRKAVREPEAFLRRVVTRLCLDQLEIRPAPARDLCRAVAAGTGCRGDGGRDRRYYPPA